MLFNQQGSIIMLFKDNLLLQQGAIDVEMEHEQGCEQICTFVG